MGVISVSSANCKNCYRCVRFCPVKAIGIKGNQARLEEHRCIYCGICVGQCPQKAKRVESGLGAVLYYRNRGEQMALSIAPSYGAAFSGSLNDLAERLRERGFNLVEETAIGAQAIAEEYRRMISELPAGRTLITSSCNVVVTYVEKYFPQLTSSLAALVSPMVAHARILKEKHGKDLRVVFAGPCIAKKHEAKESEVAGAVDVVLTFDELAHLLAEVAQSEGAPSALLRQSRAAEGGRWFPLPGGLLRAAGLPEGVLERDILIVDGAAEMMAVLAALAAGAISPRLVEILACKGGCLGGPGMVSDQTLYVRRSHFMAALPPYRREAEPCLGNITLERRFHSLPCQLVFPGEEEIKAILRSMGRTDPDKELNCGSCGYSSCQEKAIAIAQGMAETEMCLPYMRDKAENIASLVIDFAPNAIVLVDSGLIIREFNLAAEVMFQAKAENVMGKHLATIMDEVHFLESLTNKATFQVKERYDRLGLVTIQTLIYINEEDLVLGLIMDVTDIEKQKQVMETMKRETIDRAQEVIEKQMRVAQEIAGLLGETTAESKVLLTKLMHLVKEGGSDRVIP